MRLLKLTFSSLTKRPARKWLGLRTLLKPGLKQLIEMMEAGNGPSANEFGTFLSRKTLLGILALFIIAFLISMMLPWLPQNKLAGLPEFASAMCIKVNPDAPQKTVRFLTLSGKKKLLVPQPRLRTGFFSEVDGSVLLRGALAEACTATGAAKYGKPLGTDAKPIVNLIVIGSVAVDPKTGARLGKGEGFADLEYAMLRYMGAINKYTRVATTVHDKQLVDDIPTEKLRVHDVPVDIICTPTRVIYTRTSLPQPEGIYWDLLSPQKLEQIQVLRDLKRQIERKTGQLLPIGPFEELPPIAERGKTTDRSSKKKEPRIFVWNLNRSTPWTDLRDHIATFGAEALKVSLIRKETLSKPSARVLLKEGTDVEGLVKALDGSQLGKITVRAKIDES